MARGQRRPASDSLQAQMERTQAVNTNIPVPEGVTLRSDEERLLWKQYTAARLPSNWRTIDLLNLVDVVKLEMRVRELEEQVGLEGTLLPNRFGEPKPHPAAEMALKARHQRIAILRGMGLSIGVTGTEHARRENLAAPSVQDEQNARGVGGKTFSLLAVG
jgi:hypothetical protein